MRWIPKGMQVEYLGQGERHPCVPSRPLTSPPLDAAAGCYELPVTVVVTDARGTDVFRARIAMWVSPRKPA